MNIKKVKGVYKLNKKLQERLNRLRDPGQYPKEFKLSRLNWLLKIRKRKNERFAYASKKIEKNSIVFFTSGSKVSLPLRYTIQIAQKIHVIGPGIIDHRCVNPTCVIDINNNLVAKRTINPGEKITYNYLTTEYDMVNKFLCNCGEKGCFSVIRGFRYLKPTERLRLMKGFPLSNYLSELV